MARKNNGEWRMSARVEKGIGLGPHIAPVRYAGLKQFGKFLGRDWLAEKISLRFMTLVSLKKY